MYDLYVRYERAFKQQFYLITTNINKECIFNIMGTTNLIICY